MRPTSSKVKAEITCNKDFFTNIFCKITDCNEFFFGVNKFISIFNIFHFLKGNLGDNLEGWGKVRGGFEPPFQDLQSYTLPIMLPNHFFL